ncbi:hypothetical protein [Natronospora cellulosivora (SeqCode)]
MNKENAFTFLEILLIISLISLLAVISYPKYNTLIESAKIERFAREIELSLRQTKQLAIYNSRRHYFEVKDDNQFVIYKDNNDYIKSVSFDDNVKLSNVRVSFGPIGTASGRTVTIEYSDKSIDLIVSPSGRIRRGS